MSIIAWWFGAVTVATCNLLVDFVAPLFAFTFLSVAGLIQRHLAPLLMRQATMAFIRIQIAQVIRALANAVHREAGRNQTRPRAGRAANVRNAALAIQADDTAALLGEETTGQNGLGAFGMLSEQHSKTRMPNVK
jgi:hypothetical protein